ncbi:MAG: cation diffusion facilitator family transporter [Crocosphaera sp.]|nr:cation diffusion facilitator family transporter [Crocosphaera sp.]
MRDEWRHQDNLSDVFGLLVAWVGNFLAQHPPTQRYTYGLRRSSILAALFNALTLLLVMGGIASEAVSRLFNPSSISGVTIIVVALVGVIINTITALLFMSGRDHDLNIRGALDAVPVSIEPQAVKTYEYPRNSFNGSFSDAKWVPRR